ncbi:MAG: hypothetical protein RQ723_07240 [Desulfuromonadales bacterium]|nr:hypothetical protein [Desulfuromonadales bacterium]
MHQNFAGNIREWEALCRRCGRCCYEKIEFEGVVYYTDLPCEFLDRQTRLCRVYPERSRRRKGCIRLTPALLDKGFLPADCPYVAGLENYPAPKMFDES